MKNIIALLFLASFASGTSAQNTQLNDTLEVYFPLKEAAISKHAASFLDSLIFKDVLIHGQKLIVLGYADYLGGNAINDNLSKARAKNVQAYLVKSGFDQKDITLCIGKGKINRTPVKGVSGYAQDRKVQIIIDNSIQSAQAPVAPPVAAVKDITKAKVNETVTLKNILFQPGSDIFLSTSIAALNDLLRVLNDYKTMRIGIEGHICCVGAPNGTDDMYNNMPLSAARAKAVYDFLVSKGIDSSRLSYKGLGNLNPVAYPEVTEEDQMKNRRVDVRVLSK